MRSSRTTAFVIAACLLALQTEIPTAAAQCRVDQDILDEILVIDPNDTTDVIHGSSLYPRYRFLMVYDSSLTEYGISEFTRNGARLRLTEWCDSARVRTTTDSLALRSRSVALPLAAGDTLGFFRILSWYDRGDTHAVGHYYARDTLNYSVELVQATDSSEERLALLDSVGILRSVPRGAPVVYGNHPIIAHIKYAVPQQFHGRNAFLRVKLYAQGDGPYHFIREDRWTTRLSGIVDSASTQQYLAQFGPKRVRDLGQKISRDAIATLDVAPNPSPGRVTIRFTVDIVRPRDALAVAIYDSRGERVYVPFYTTAYVNPGEATYEFPDNGVYFVALYLNGRLVARERVTITR